MKFMLLIHQGATRRHPAVRVGGMGRSRTTRRARCTPEAEDLDAATALASQIPAARMGGAIEVRPIVER